MSKRKPPPTLAARVKYVRTLVSGLPMRTLSTIAGLSPSVIGHVERGDTTTLSIGSYIKLADACGVSLVWLMRGEGMAPDEERTTRLLRAAWAEQPTPKKSGPKVKPVVVRQ